MSEHFCVACNMCCDGSIFDRVEVVSLERDQIGPRRDIRLDAVEGYHYFPQSCGQLNADGSCGCYSVRPGRCRAYMCTTAGKVERGEIDAAEASEIIGRILARRDAFVGLCREEVPTAFWPAGTFGARGAFTAMRAAFDAGSNFPTPVRNALFRAWFAYLEEMRTHIDDGFADLSAVAARAEARRRTRAAI